MKEYDIFAEVGIVVKANNEQEAKDKLYNLLKKFNIHYHEIIELKEN